MVFHQRPEIAREQRNPPPDVIPKKSILKQQEQAQHPSLQQQQKDALPFRISDAEFVNNRRSNDYNDDDNHDGSSSIRSNSHNDDNDGEDDDDSSHSSSYTEGGTRKARVTGLAKKVKTAIDKRLHLEMFGITWFDFAAISCARWCFLLALLGAAAGFATTVYKKTREDEISNFETSFEEMAHEIIELANDKALSVLKIMAGVATTMTSNIGQEMALELASSSTSSSPAGFHTMPDMEKHFGTARNASGALVLAYAPLVQANQVDAWATYSEANQGWIDQTTPSSSSGGGGGGASSSSSSSTTTTGYADPILPFIWTYAEDDSVHAYLKGCKSDQNAYAHLNDKDKYPQDEDLRIPLTPSDGRTLFSPIWTYSPGPDEHSSTENINHDLFTKPNLEAGLQSVQISRQPMFLDVCNLAIWFDDVESELEAVIGYPIYAGFGDNAPVVGNMIEIFPWRTFLENILTDPSRPVVVDLTTSCAGDSGDGGKLVASFMLVGAEVVVVQQESTEDAHFHYHHLAVSEPFAVFANPPDMIAQQNLQGVCSMTLTVHPTRQMQNYYSSDQPLQYAMIVLIVFLATSVLFCLFDRLMTRQRDNIMKTAKKQNMIVSSLFPKSVQAQMMEQVDADHNTLSKVGKAGLRQYIQDEEQLGRLGVGFGKDIHSADKKSHERGIGIADKSKPIADLFPDTTIMFGDIAGFTAWSSARDPSQVFVLLETIYHEFDAIAKRRRVFKVEVIGDCYVAVCGLPDPRPDHAVVMAKFATECIYEMNRLCQELEVELGPDTTELGFRVGLHSGPVVAGVLRGEKSRFQLFGDTMNTAARMESTGIPNRVQISEATKELLETVNKSHWYEMREDKVKAKGKGELTTYLLKLNRDKGSGNSSGYASESDAQSVASSLNSDVRYRDEKEVDDKRNRIADWTVEVLADLLQEIERRRRASLTKSDPHFKILQLEQSSGYTGENTVIDQVKEIIELPEFNISAEQREAKLNAYKIELGDSVMTELRSYVRTIATMYHENAFHNFPHANHVTMSVVKLLGRINAPDVSEVKTTLHDHTYGITSDPLTRFAVVFSALIHDVDHMGVSNMQLVKEEDPLAQLYKNKSVAEQNSIDIAWDLLMEPRFDNLRKQIYTTEDEFKRFRQLVINTVLATDIMDKDLKELRNKRWEKAFSQDHDNNTRENINRKATIVIEHLIQASDVAHTMQHWHMYRKWNERLFQELYRAWEAGRLENDPSIGWYKGEMGFFDFYIIPLAKKLKECGVFGVSSDEYLSYALQNRKEWEARGEDLVKEMVKNLNRKRVARSVFDASRANIDHEGKEIVADMAKAIRRSSKKDACESHFSPVPLEPLHKLPESVMFQNQELNVTDHAVDLQLDEEDSSVDSEFEEELEMKLKPM